MQNDNRFTYKDGLALKEFLLTKIEVVVSEQNVTHKALEKRLDSMNEFRESLKDQTATFIPVKEAEIMIDKIRLEQKAVMLGIEKDIRELRENKAKLEGKADQSNLNIVLVISILGTIISIVSVIINWLK